MRAPARRSRKCPAPRGLVSGVRPSCYHACMGATLTIRVDDQLAELARERARDQGVSLNQFANDLLRAALDPASNGDAVESLRERLRRAGLQVSRLAAPSETVQRPNSDLVTPAMSAAGRGQPLSDLVSEVRG
jgi:HicB family